jgi:site-specific DNA-methyltransferase (adenine-specific)
MGKKWDSSGIAYDQSLWEECLRVLKPGGHLIAFGGTRTYHRMTCAIEDAGFEIRDCIQWIYGSGFPKSLDVSKAIDKQAGAEREKIKTPITPHSTAGKGISNELDERPWLTKARQQGYHEHDSDIPVTDAAKAWHGFGTALKPANEPAVLARKPLSGTVADNVLTWGCGALNIDGCRITHNEPEKRTTRTTAKFNGVTMHYYEHADGGINQLASASPIGRWPANVIFDEEAAQMLDEQSGNSTSVASIRKKAGKSVGNKMTLNNYQMNVDNFGGYSDSGGASRFFYVAKASKAEREAGLDEMEVAPIKGRDAGQDERNVAYKLRPIERANHHPTVKPITLMRYLVRLVTPPNGVVLDPFMGSGSTGCAAMLEKVQFIGIELNQEYVDIAEKRIRHWMSKDFIREE